MDATESASPTITAALPLKAGMRRSRLPLALCALFLLSGSSGLIYEVVWLRMLSRTLGSTVYATSTILAVFMGGLALGSLIFGNIADRIRRPLVLYACIEAAIGVTAILSLGMNSWPIPLYREVYSLTAGSRTALTAGQVIVAMAALLLPTTLMGATLPTLCAYGVRRTSAMVRVAGTLYSLNTLGAMAGVLAGGFVLIGAIGETRTILIGAAINALVAIIALTFFGSNNANGGGADEITRAAGAEMDAEVHGRQTEVSRPVSRRVAQTVLICFAVSGFFSLAMEIVWSRMLTLDLGTSVYAFSAMLFFMLAGIGIGGWLGGGADRWKDPLQALARLELGIALFAAYGLWNFRNFDVADVILPPLVMVFPAALLMGIAFPVAVRCYADHARSIGRRVGELYAWNTMGCIAGSLAGGFVLLPMFGASLTGTLLVALTTIAALALFMVHPRGIRSMRLLDFLLVLSTIGLTSFIGDSYRDVIFSRISRGYPRWTIFGQAEEAAATTTAFGDLRHPTSRVLWVNGHGMTILLTGNKLMADLPLWFSDSPRDALVICLGMGTTFRTATRHADVDVTVVELVHAVTEFLPFYHSDAMQVLAQPNAHVVVDDGRNYLLTHDRKYDAITIDPAPPLYSAGTVNLYSVEFFKLCLERLRPTGVLCLWVPPAPMSESKMILRTFATTLPYVLVFEGPTYRGFYLIGTFRPLNYIKARIERGFSDPKIVADLKEWGDSSDTPEKVLALHVCDRDGLLRFTQGSPILTDDRPYTEFPLWRMRGGDPEYDVLLESGFLRRWLAEHPEAPAR
jgi:spermidine synthase